jgi:hypothetical protein
MSSSRFDDDNALRIRTQSDREGPYVPLN